MPTLSYSATITMLLQRFLLASMIAGVAHRPNGMSTAKDSFFCESKAGLNRLWVAPDWSSGAQARGASLRCLLVNDEYYVRVPFTPHAASIGDDGIIMLCSYEAAPTPAVVISRLEQGEWEHVSRLPRRQSPHGMSSGLFPRVEALCDVGADVLVVQIDAERTFRIARIRKADGTILDSSSCDSALHSAPGNRVAVSAQSIRGTSSFLAVWSSPDAQTSEVSLFSSSECEVVWTKQFSYRIDLWQDAVPSYEARPHRFQLASRESRRVTTYEVLLESDQPVVRRVAERDVCSPSPCVPLKSSRVLHLGDVPELQDAAVVDARASATGRVCLATRDGVVVVVSSLGDVRVVHKPSPDAGGAIAHVAWDEDLPLIQAAQGWSPGHLSYVGVGRDARLVQRSYELDVDVPPGTKPMCAFGNTDWIAAHDTLTLLRKDGGMETIRRQANGAWFRENRSIDVSRSGACAVAGRSAVSIYEATGTPRDYVDVGCSVYRVAFEDELSLIVSSESGVMMWEGGTSQPKVICGLEHRPGTVYFPSLAADCSTGELVVFEAQEKTISYYDL